MLWKIGNFLNPRKTMFFRWVVENTFKAQYIKNINQLNSQIKN